MNYLKLLFTLLTFFAGTFVFAQDTDIKAELIAARTSYNSGNLEDARFALERSLNELNNVIAREIWALLPNEIGGMPAFNADDETIGNTAGVGIFVSRTYKDGDIKNAEVTITDHSPMIAMVNAFLSNPMLANMSMVDTGQKSVKVSGYKGMLQKNESDDGGVAYSINIPFGDSLLTVETEDIDSEEDALALAGEVPLDQIAELVK